MLSLKHNFQILKILNVNLIFNIYLYNCVLIKVKVTLIKNN